MWSNKCWNLGCNTFPWSIGCVPANIFQEAVGHSCFQGTELNRAHVQLAYQVPGATPAELLHRLGCCAGASLPRAALCICPCWVSYSSCRPLTSACLGCPEQQPDPPEYHPFVPFIWCHLQIQCKWIPSTPPDYGQRHEAGWGPEDTPVTLLGRCDPLTTPLWASSSNHIFTHLVVHPSKPHCLTLVS